MNKQRVVIAGGVGFIGTNLSLALLKRGDCVICVDYLSSGNRNNVEMLGRYNGYTFLERDIRNPFVLEGHVDAIINLACPASPVFYQSDAVGTTKTCVFGTLNLLELARKHDCVYLQASTSEVYGDAMTTPQQENYWGNVNPVGIRSCYDEGKRCAESLCMDYHRQYDVQVKIIRIFNTYGPYMRPDDGRVMSNQICQALKGETMTVYGSGKQTRSFQYIDDLIEAITRMLKTPSHITGPLNIGNPHEITVNELADIITRMTNSKSEIQHLSLPQDDPKRRCPDISLAADTLNGWKPRVCLEDGVRMTIEYFKEII